MSKCVTSFELFTETGRSGQVSPSNISSLGHNHRSDLGLINS